MTCSSALGSEVHRVHLVNKDQRVRMEPPELQAFPSKVNQEIQDHRGFRVLLDFQASGGPKEKREAKDSRVIKALMDSASLDHLDLPDLLVLQLICTSCSSM